MEKKNNLLKNIFYIFFAFCFFSIGVMTLNTEKNHAKAEDTSVEVLDNQELPTYFSTEEYLDDADANTLDEKNPSAIDETFLYFSEGGISNYYKLSFLTNKDGDVSNDIYKWVYYPDQDNKSVFHYYYINSVSLYINGEDQDITKENFADNSHMSFPAKSSVNLQSFDMIFTGKSTPTAKNEISIIENGKVKEGIYEVSITYTLFTCTDGKSDLSETVFQPDQNFDLTYKFYVLDKTHYLETNAPNVTVENFDHKVNISSQHPNYSKFLYSNYSSKGAENAIPYIEYDYTRFELDITNDTSSTKIVYDKDTRQPILQGDNLIEKIYTSGNTCRVYFINTDEYEVTFNPIKLVDYKNSEAGTTAWTKFGLNNLSSATKKFRVYVFGYQAKHTDFDKPVDENEMHPTTELKDYDTANGVFTNSADITSGFLNYDTNYSQDTANTTFLISNIVDYIQNESITPITTNQPPIDLATNAKIASNSYIYSTTQVSQAYSLYTGVTLNGKALYRAKFNGFTDSAEGKYIYVISYTYDHYYQNETTLNTKKTFYQVFYFEVQQQLPNIQVKTVDADNNPLANLPSEAFTNKNVTIIDNNQDYIYNKDVRVQVYAQDYAGNFLTSFGGSLGQKYDGQIFSENAHYTIRLFFENEIKDNESKLDYNYEEKIYFKQRTFTIDKTEIENIKGRNVTAILNTTNYKVVSALENFSTNQSMILSWDTKSSGAETYAYYRYFPLDTAQYYSQNTDEALRKDSQSDILSRMLYYDLNNSYLPINAMLDLDTNEYNWDKYYGNTDGMTTVSTEYVFTDAGLYLVDVYDSAGNHKVEVFMIDNTSPIFAIENKNTNILEIATPSMYVTEPSTLFWAKNKAIYIKNFDTLSYNSIADINNLTVDSLVKIAGTDPTYYDLYTTYDKTPSLDILKKLYLSLFKQNYLQLLNTNVAIEDDDNVDLTDYRGYYMTIPIDTTSYYVIRGTENNPSYQKQTNVSSYDIEVEQEMTYTVLIRDMSNTLRDKDPNVGLDAQVQFTNYSSASQTIRVSHDSSHFVIQYTPTGSSQPRDLFANSSHVSDSSTPSHKSQVSYISPTSMKKTFTLSFTPTVKDEVTIQVHTVTINYYPYEQVTRKIDGIEYNYYQLSENASIDTVYEYPINKENYNTVEYEIRPDSNGYTREGKYEITRKYYIESGFSYNSNDYFERTYILYVDRNEVISPATRVTNSETNKTHLESLVGGDVFVAMYDNQKKVDLVLTFPNSDQGNTNGSILYNNASNPKPLFTTNMLPINVYIPQYKYTTFAERILGEEYGGNRPYSFNVNFDYSCTKNTSNWLYKDKALTESELQIAKDTYIKILEVYSNSTKINYNGTEYYISNDDYETIKNQNFYGSENLIAEYALYAEIYKDGEDSTNLIAKTSNNYTNPTIDSLSSTNGFLNFYDSENNPIQYLSEAGTYYVILYQGRFGIKEGANDENNFEQYIKFCFKIEKPDPDFEIQTTKNTALEGTDNNYYTNQPNVNLVWEAGSTFMADIDIDEIRFKTNSSPTEGYRYGDADSKKYIIGEPTLNSGLYVAKLDLEALGVYSHGGWVDVSMRYKNHDSRLYNIVTKRIIIDLSAPSENIQKLVAKSTSSNLISALTESSLRTYYTAKEGEIASSLLNTSYNISNSTGNFKYYSYTVVPDFINELNIADKTYIRKFETGTKYNNNYSQETAPSDFLTSNFKSLSNFEGFEVGNYYEIVESDFAGNLTIYTVYITSYETMDDPIICLKNSEGNVREYTIDDYKETLSYEKATHNLYALTGYQLESINFFGDSWAQFRITTYDTNNSISTTKTLMLTPWDSQRVYAFDGSDTPSLIYIRDLINGSKNIVKKDNILVYDRNTQLSTAFYINIQSTQFKPTFTTNQNEEYITFSMPSDQTIQNPMYATSYLTELKITAEGIDSPLYDKKNKLGFASLWTNSANDDVVVEYNQTFSRITFRLNPNLNFDVNTKITYQYTDNFGRTSTKIHLYKEPIILTEITSQNTLYSYYNELGKLIYLTKDGFQYHYNPDKESIKVFELANSESEEGKAVVSRNVVPTDLDSQKARFTDAPSEQAGVWTFTVNFNPIQNIAGVETTVKNYNDTYVLKIYDKNAETTEISRIYFKLYNELPQPNDGTSGTFRLLDANGNDITQKIVSPNDPENLGYFSEVRLLYNTTETFIPVKFSISKDLEIWQEVNTGTRLKCENDEMEKYYLKVWYDETYMKNELGTPEYIFGNVDENQIYEFNLSSLTATYWIENSITGDIIQKDDSMFETPDGAQYSNHYIVNVDYSNRDAIKIKTNEELGIRYFEDTAKVFSYSSNVTSQVYLITNTKDAYGAPIELGNIPAFETTIVITYVPTSDDIAKHFYTYDMNGKINENENLINLTSKTIVISEDFASIDKIELQWTKYYGFPQNEINIMLVKDGIELSPTTYTRTTATGEYNYVYLTHSGKYQIYLKDKSGNIQKFNRGMVGQSDYLTFIFLKDVPFTVTYINPQTQEEETSIPIKQAVYNGTVKLNIDKNTRSDFYIQNGYPKINVKRNGVEYTGYNTNNSSTQYTFTETGYYEVFFEAISNENFETIRQEVYGFTILDPNENKYSYIFNSYSNYYVEKIVKNGIDITSNLIKSLDVNTISIKKNGETKQYLQELPLSYLDEKTGAGTYIITINSNDKFYQNSGYATTWTYQVRIQVGTAPIKISLKEGESTTGSINFTLNQSNLFAEMGNCIVRVVSYSENNQPVVYTNGTEPYLFKIDENSTGEISKDIDKTGTYYVQVLSHGDNLLYSYKVVRAEPMNAATIIAIVVSAVVLIVIIFIVIKLRKRISVK